MKTKLIRLTCFLTALLALATLARAQGTAFTYQGRLTENGATANGANDFTFTLYDAASGGATVGVSNVVNDLAVTNGLFTVTLDFGAAFDGNARWLQIGVRPGASAGAYNNLVPRQPITATPYAMRALSADSAGSATTAASVAAGAVNHLALANDAVDGAKILNGSITSADLNASLLNGTFWNLGGNAGTTPGTQFLGTTDNQPLEFKVNGTRALRLEPMGFADTVNVIGGSARNFVGMGAVGATIGGGGAGNSLFGNAYTNRVDADFGTVSGGAHNTIQAYAEKATIGGGSINTIRTNAEYATIGGGVQNTIETNALYATIAGGDLNTASGQYATVPGGVGNTAGGQFSFAAGHDAKALHDGAFVWSDSPGGTFGSTASNQFLIRAGGGVGIGTPNPQGSLHVYSANNPTVVRIQSAGTPGFGRVEFVSNPQGDANEWRPGFIQSTDNGGFTGGLAFFVNGTGAGNKFGSNEVMRVVNGAVGIGTGTAMPVSALQVVGTVTATAFNPPSDRNLKENFAPVSPREVLDKVAALPISRWNFIGDVTTPHVGPMAQDFHAAFGLGTDDKHIATVDADGVALAAIQGLNQKLEETRAENSVIKSKNQSLEQRLERLEQLLNQNVRSKD
jgi:Chaperone of endosialidase